MVLSVYNIAKVTTPFTTDAVGVVASLYMIIQKVQH